MKERDTHTYTQTNTHTSGTFVPRFLPGRAGERNRKSLRGTGSPGRELPGSLGSCDGDEFRVAVAVPLPALLHVRLRPGKGPPGVSALPGALEGAAPPLPRGWWRRGEKATRSPPPGRARALRPAGPGSDRARLRPPPAGCSRTWTLGRSNWPPGARSSCPSAACTSSPA